MKIITLPGRSIRIVNNYVYFYSYYDEDLISLFKKLKFRWNKDYKAWYADLNDFANTKDFLSHISPLQSYFSQNEISYATHCIGHYFNKLPEIIGFSRKETSDFPVPLPENLSLYSYQKAGVEFLVKKRNALLADSMGLGKAEYVGNRVWTPYGRVKIGKLKVGDKIFSYTGELTTVTGVYPQGKQPLYRVSFSDGCSVLTTAEHLWEVIDSEDKQLVLSLEKIMQMDYKNLKIPLANPLKYPKNFLPFPPYTFGMIMSHEISRSKNDEVYIPDVYKYSSLDDRISLLQGVADHIGCINGDSDICIKTNGNRIVADIAELIHSLGGLAIKQKKHELIIKLPASFIPFRSIHKLENYSPSNNLARYITSIEFEKIDNAVCISVDHPSSLYLTEHAIVTHNTVQFIGYLNYTIRENKKLKVLVICPSSVKYNWQKELEKWCIDKLNILVLEGRNGFQQDENVDVYICNYDILQGKEFTNLDCIVIDESHYIKSYQTIRTNEVQRICHSNKQAKIVALTGTPMLNRPVELFPILNLLYPEKFNNFFSFAYKYCGAHKKEIHTKEGKKTVWDFSGATNTEELARILRSTIMLRREKSQVLHDLPEKIRTVIPVKKSINTHLLNIEEKTKEIIDKIKKLNIQIQMAKKEQNNNDLLNKLRLEKTETKSVALRLINEYRRLAFEEKKDTIVEFLEDTLENEPVVLFVHHREVADFFKKRFAHLSPVVITGETPANERHKIVEEFQRGETPIFIGTILAAAEGITLTRASTVVFAEYEWTPAKMKQAEDRCHRIGQKNTVNSYWFTLVDSIDEMFIDKIIKKLELEKEIMQDVETEEIFMMLE